MHFTKVYTVLILVLFTLKMHATIDTHDQPIKQHSQPMECECSTNTPAGCHHHGNCCNNYPSKKMNLSDIQNRDKSPCTEYSRFIPDVLLQAPFKPPSDHLVS